MEIVPCMISHGTGQLTFNKFPLLEKAGLLEKARERIRIRARKPNEKPAKIRRQAKPTTRRRRL